MWHSTEKMAESVGQGVLEKKVSVQVMDLHGWHRSDVVTELLDARGLVLGSPTLNNGMLPRMADMICYTKGLRFPNRVGAAFGSYGWGGEAVKLLNEALDEMKVRRVHEGLRVQYVPTAEDLDLCRKLGHTVAAAVLAEPR
jgi:flavorubredoxin